MTKKNVSVLKNVRQNKKRNLANKALKSEIKTYYIEIMNEIKNKAKDKAQESLKKYISKLDKAVKNKIIHINNSSRKKSQIMKLLNKSFKETNKETKEANA